MKKKTGKKALWLCVCVILCVIIVGAICFLFKGGCKMGAKTAEIGDLVVVDYVGKHVNGGVFDTSIESVAREANIYSEGRDYTTGLEFTVGAGQMIEGFDEAVVGMKEGESKTVDIPVDKAYGEKRDDLIIRVPLEDAGDISGLEVGMRIMLGGVYPATVQEITDSEIVFDGNHELAGENLVFDITLKSVEKAEKNEGEDATETVE